MEPDEKTHLDLFSGIGGFALAALWGGYRTVCFVERDLYCQQVLRKNFPGVPICHNIHFCGKQSARWWDNRPIDLLTGGFPCQPVSCAGKRKGKEDDRWLWPEMLRVVKELKPRWVLGENVAGLINMGLDDVVSDLEGEGYEVAPPLVVPACAVGAPHRRDRVWIIAHAGEQQHEGDRDALKRPPPEKLHAPDSFQSRLEGQPRHGAARDKSGRERKEADGSAGESGLCSDAANTESLRCRQEYQNAGGPSEGKAETEKWRRPADGGWWESEPAMGELVNGLSGGLVRFAGRVAKGVPNRVKKLRALGNAIVPGVAFEIIKAINEND